MAKYYNILITSGDAPGPYTIYYNSVDPLTIATRVSTGTSATSIPYLALSTSPGVTVEVPDNSTSVILHNPSCNSSEILLLTTPVPSSTSTPTPTATATPVPATDTPTPTATQAPDTATPTPTATSVPPTDTPTPTPTSTPVTTTAPPAAPTDTPTPVPSYNYYFVRGCPSTFYENQDMVIRTYSTLTDANGNPNSSSVIYHNGGSFYAYSTTNVTAWNNNEGDLNSITYSGTVDTGCPNIATATPVPATATPTPVPATATPTPVPGVPSETLGDGATSIDACNDFAAGTGTVRYMDADFFSATVIYRSSNGTGNAAAGYYSDGSLWRYWNGTSFTTNGICPAY